MPDKEIVVQRFLEKRQNIGMSLIFVGITISMFLNYFVPIIHWTPFIMLLSCILLCEKTTFRVETETNRTFKTLIFFQLLMLFYLVCFFNSEADAPWSKQLSFHFYILAIIAIFLRTPSLKERNFLPTLLVISSVLTIITALCNYFDLFELARRLVRIGEEQNIVLEAFSANIATFVNFICCMLLLHQKQRLVSLLLIFLIIIDVYNIVQSGKRSYFVAMGGVAILYLYKCKNLIKGLAIASSVLVILFILLPPVQDAVFDMVERTITGFMKVYGDNESRVLDWDDSASIRVFLQERAMNNFLNFSILNLIFGGGYLCSFMDNPLVESYIDMGVAGLLLYVYTIILIPCVFFLRINQVHKVELFGFFLAFMNICICLTNNDPYIYLTYTPLCLIALYSYNQDYDRYSESEEVTLNINPDIEYISK